MPRTRRPGEKQQTKAYTCWRNVKARCEDKENRSYPNYGGRGIVLCERWQDFDKFVGDMGEPDAGMTLDRIDNDRGYQPGNCRWISRAEQSRNTTRNKRVSINGVTKCLKDWCVELKLPYSSVAARINVLGWPVGKALFTPIRKLNRGL